MKKKNTLITICIIAYIAGHAVIFATKKELNDFNTEII